MKKIILFLILSISLSGQNLDSLYQKYIQIKTNTFTKLPTITSSDEAEHCLLGISAQIRQNYFMFSKQQQLVLSSLMQRPKLDTSFVSPSGKFRIHYNKSGYNVPAYNVNDLAIAADSVYKFEINILGYPIPVTDNINGGDNKYDIYIDNLGTGNYGSTEVEDLISDNRYTTFMLIDNDFGVGYYTHGIDAAKVTLAHEFHHAIQISNYGLRFEDRYYHELSSTAMEEFVFDEINDYYYEADKYFSKPQKAISTNNGYNLAILNIFLKDRFGFDILKEIWNGFKNKRAIEAISDAIVLKGSTLSDEFNVFGQWTYFTGKRAIPGRYFKEAEFYPEITTQMNMDLQNGTASVLVSSEPISNNYLMFYEDIDNITNEIVAIVTNADIASSIASTTVYLPFTYYLSNGSKQEYVKVVDKYYSKLESQNSHLLSESNIFNGLLVNNGNVQTEQLNYAFPQPFRYSIHEKIFIPVDPLGNLTAELSIYSLDMNLVYSAELPVIKGEKVLTYWNGLNNNSQKLASGVYLWVTKSGDYIKKGKLAILND